MNLEAEIKTLKRQNRRLKFALFSTLTVLVISAAVVAGMTALVAARARTEQLRAVDMERRARAQLAAAMAAKQAELDRSEAIPAGP